MTSYYTSSAIKEVQWYALQFKRRIFKNNNKNLQLFRLRSIINTQVLT